MILVGEMRDLETIHMALTAAETGHLVFATLHTQSAPQTVDRIVDVFPPGSRAQIRVMLATTLQAVVTQQLVPTADGSGRTAAVEMLIATPAVRNLIRESKGHQLTSQMQTGGSYGMVTMDQNLAELVRAGRITLETALEQAPNPRTMRDLLGIEPRSAVADERHLRVQGARQRRCHAQGSHRWSERALVVAKLREMGYVPVSVTAQGRSKLTADVSLRTGGKLDLGDVVIFSRQLATMVSAGLTLIRSLGILADQTESKPLAAVIEAMRSDIERGLSFSQAISKHPKIFSPLYVAMVRSGEAGGMLDEVLARLATTLERQQALRRKVKSAMSYPVAVGILIVLVVSAMLLFIVPMFESMYNDLGGELPLPTRLLIGVSNFLGSIWWLIVLTIGGSVVAWSAGAARRRDAFTSMA